MIIAATGHRPADITEDWGIVTLKARVKLQNKASRLICGMAWGFDLLAAEAAMELDLPITAARPWAGHGYKDEFWGQKYEQVIDYADAVINVNQAQAYPGPQCLMKRNEWMVDQADAVMAYWNGKMEGGTYACRNYAKDKGVPVANIYHDPPF